MVGRHGDQNGRHGQHIEPELQSVVAPSARVATPRSVAYQVINARANARRRCRERESTSLFSNPNVQASILDHVGAYVEKYKDYPAVRMWAPGNENLHRVL